MADLWSSLTGGATHTGSWNIGGIGLPDLGVTEAFAYNGTNEQGGSNIVPDPIQNKYVAPALNYIVPGLNVSAPGTVKGVSTSTPPPSNNNNNNNGGSGGGGNGGGGGGGGDPITADVLRSKFGFNDSNVINQILSDPGRVAQYARELSGSNGNGNAEAEARRAAEEARIKSAISSEYDPIFAELDRQVGMLPGQQKQYEDYISQLTQSQQASAEAEKAKGMGVLDTAQKGEESTAKSSLRSLEEDIRNQLAARQYYFGARGAGNSSATERASEAITRAGLKGRSQILSTLQSGINQLDQKRSDVQSLATEQGRKIDDWKNTNLMQTVKFFTDRLDSLNSQKVNANAQKAQAIAQMVTGLSQQLTSRLQQLDDQVTQYKQAVNTWQMQRQADLEDYATKLQLAAKYNTNSSAYDNAKLNFQKIVNPVTGETAIYGLNPYSGETVSQTGQISPTTSKKDQGLFGDIGSFLFGSDQPQVNPDLVSLNQ